MHNVQVQAELLWKYNLERTDFLKKGQRFAAERFGLFESYFES